MARYRYLAADLLSGTIREEVPFDACRYAEVLNRPGSIEATIGLRHAKATRAILAPGLTALHVERDGAIRWSGILWTAKASSSKASLTVGGQGWWSYFRRRHVRETLAFAQADQLEIARALVAYAQAQPGGDLGVALGAEASGVLRDRTYEWWARKNVGLAVEELAGVSGGFDFEPAAAWAAGGRVAWSLRLHYPRRGRPTALVWELGGNLDDLDEEEDATRQAGLVDGIGAGDGEGTLIATASDPAPGYPLLEDVRAWKDVSVPATLQAHADAALKAGRLPLDRVPRAVAKQDHPDTTLGAFEVGDTVTLRARDGWIDVAYPGRIMEVGVSVDREGAETVDVAYADEAATL